MYTNTQGEGAKRVKRSWRRHSDEFKARLIAQASQPHVSMAAVALANGINANMLRRWVRASGADIASDDAKRASSAPLSFVQLTLPAATPSPTPVQPSEPETIEVQIQRDQASVRVILPLHIASAAWLREVLR